MCGRVIQKSSHDRLSLGLVEGLQAGSGNRFGNVPPRYNGAPGQDLWVIRRNPDAGERSLDLLRWGLIPHFFADRPKPPPINARAETVDQKPMFRRAFAKRRCIVPIDGFFEWRSVAGGAKQPFAIAMADRTPFGLAGLWENWRDPASGEAVRTFCILTTRANALMQPIHDRMPVILPPSAYEPWLAGEPVPPDIFDPYPAEPMTLWPVSTRVNAPKNDDPGVIAPMVQADASAPPDGNSA